MTPENHASKEVTQTIGNCRRSVHANFNQEFNWLFVIKLTPKSDAIKQRKKNQSLPSQSDNQKRPRHKLIFTDLIPAILKFYDAISFII